MSGPVFDIIWPNRRTVDAEQIRLWASDDLANEEQRKPSDLQSLPLEWALAVVEYYGGVTLARHGLALPEYERGAEIPGVRWRYECLGHPSGFDGPGGVTEYCDGSCRGRL